MKIQNSNWIHFKASDFRGVIDFELKSILTEQFLENIDRQPVVRGGRVVRDSRIRWAGIIPIQNNKVIFVKQFRVVNRWQFLKYLILPSRSRHEWAISRFLTEKGIPTPKPLGVIERRKRGVLKSCFFVTEALWETTDLISFCKKHFHKEDLASGKMHILSLVAILTRKIHNIGLFHRDLHGGNFLVYHNGPVSLFLVDLHHAQKRRKVSRKKRLWNVAQILHSLDFMLTIEEKKLFLLSYGQGRFPMGKKLEASLQTVEKTIKKMARRRWKSRAKRCLKESTIFSLGVRDDLKIYRRREIPEEDVMGIIKAHTNTARFQKDRLLKHSSRSVVSMVCEVKTHGLPVCVKEYRYKTVLDQMRSSLFGSKGKVAWVTGNILFNRGICPMKPLAYVERWRFGFVKRGFLLTESLSDYIEMDLYLIKRFEKGSRRELRKFIEKFADWVGILHRSGIYHRDFKTRNILVRDKPDGWDFSLIDLEDVLTNTIRIGIKEIHRNLVQINCSVPKFFTLRDRIRFFKSYLQTNPVDLDERVFIRKAIEESKLRGVVYVSPQGVVMERFE